MTDVANDAAFANRLATGMQLGAHTNGNLRMSVTTPEGEHVFELPPAWLHGETGLKQFIQTECHQ